MGKILSITKSGTPDHVYDPVCSYPHTYISNGFVSHNCTLLIDEVEKLFVSEGDNGVLQRLLSQLLWWLSEHKSQVLTVMTTNDYSKLPPELFREGRVDLSMEIPDLTPTQATELGHAYMKHLLGGKITMKQATSLVFTGSDTLPAVKVLTKVVDVMHTHGWGLPKKS